MYFSDLWRLILWNPYVIFMQWDIRTLCVSRSWIGHGFGVQRASSFGGSEVCFGLISAYDKAMSRKVCVFLEWEETWRVLALGSSGTGMILLFKTDGSAFSSSTLQKQEGSPSFCVTWKRSSLPPPCKAAGTCGSLPLLKQSSLKGRCVTRPKITEISHRGLIFFGCF